jgi:hypothetical protein
MDFEPSTSRQQQQQQLFSFTPFPKYSVNIVTGPTSVGKTYFVKQIVNNYKTFFSGPVSRVVVVLCNARVQSIDFDPDLDLPVEQTLLSDFVPDHLEDNDLVIIDDLQHVTPEVKLTISVCAHHQSLASLFVITHSLLGSPQFGLLSLSHRVFLFLGSTANKRLTNYILDHFYTDPEVKGYLKTVLNFCSHQNQVLALELSPVGGGVRAPQAICAFSHLAQLTATEADKRYCFLYPLPHFGETFVNRFQAEPPVTTTANMSVTFLNETRDLPANTLIALPAQFVSEQQQQRDVGSTDHDACADRTMWETTLQDIEDNIESYFPIKKWKVCKNLAKEILSNSGFCITQDGKYMHLVDKPHNTKVNLISFIGLATRKAGPTEHVLKKPEWHMYSPHIQTLLAHGTPRELFVNTLLLPPAAGNKRKKLRPY